MNHNESLPLKDDGAQEASGNEEVPVDAVDSLTPDREDLLQTAKEAHPEPSFGDRLRASRERHGMSLRDCAHTLRLPIRLLEKLEADNYEGIDYSVYLRGYLRKYAKLVRLDRQHVEAQLESLMPRQPELVAGPTLPAWKRVVERYSNAVIYVVLTAVIVVPLVWFGLHGVLNRDMARLEPLNATPVGKPPAREAAGGVASTPGAGANASGPAAKPAASDGGQAALPSQKPLMASIAPFSVMQSPLRPEPSQPAPAPAQAGTRLSLSLQQPSWVEITDGAGNHLEYKLLPAGSHRDYRSDQPLNVRIGNAAGAQVEVDGKPVALESYTRAKVAHFDIGSDGKIEPDNS